MFLLKKIALFAAVALVSSCGQLTKKPLDARTRDRIDSTANAQSRLARNEVDSFFHQNHERLLHIYMDSLIVVRRREIEAQIQSARGGN